MTILAAEITSSITKIGLFTHKYNSHYDQTVIDQQILVKEFQTLDYADEGLENMIGEFCQKYYNTKEHGKIYCVCIGVPAQVKNGSCSIQRSGKTMILTEDGCRSKLPEQYQVVTVKLINDMVAIGSRILVEDGEADLDILYSGDETEDFQLPSITTRRSLLLVSDGLGNSLWQKVEDKLFSTSFERGHERFAPQSDCEWELCKYIKGKIQQKDAPNKSLDEIKVRFENILCRQGFILIYQFLKDEKKDEYGEGIVNLTERIENVEKDPDNPNNSNLIADIVKDIIANAVAVEESQQQDKVCLASLELFIKIWGERAGDLAMGDETGIIYTGGIFIELQKFREIFITPFLEKDIVNSRNYAHNKDVHIKVFREENSVLIGAARYIAEDVPTGKFALMATDVDED